MSWISSIIAPTHERRDDAQHIRARRRAETRVKLVSNLRNTAQGLAALQAKQQQQQSGDLPERTRADRGNQPQLIGGNSTEARAVYLALEQCLFHGIRVKEFGVVPLWAFLERVERLPLSGTAGTKPSSRDRGLSSVRNSVGAVASLSNVSTPLGRARAWIRQCLVSKCLEACIATMLEEDRLVKVFYEATALVRCREGSTIFLRLCSALEAFDLTVDIDQSGLDSRPRWPILDEEVEMDRRHEEEMASAANANANAAESSSSKNEPSTMTWFEQQRERQHQEQRAEGRGVPERRNWAASALSEIDQFGQQISQGETWEKLDGVLDIVTSKVDQAVQSLDDKIIDLFGSQGQHHDNPEAATDQHRTPAQPSSSGNSHPNAHSLPGDGWVELRGGDSSSKATSSARGAFLEPLDTHRVSEGGWGFDARSPRGIAGSAAHSAHLAHSTAGYPGAFIMGKRRERGGRKARVFGTPLDDLLMNPDRCKRGLLDPALGVPDAVSSLLEALKRHDIVNTRGLFVQEATESDLLRIVKSLEKRNSVPNDHHHHYHHYHSGDHSPRSPSWLVSRLKGGHSWEASGHGKEGGDESGGHDGEGAGLDPHVLGSTLVYFLHRLPEPLLTFSKREAFLSCEAIPDLDARVRNVKLLVEDLPSAHKPLLLAIADLLSFSSNANSHNSEKSRAAMVVRDAAEGLAPAILRAPPSTSQTAFGGDASVSPTASSWRPGWEDEMVATDVVELILSEQDRVLEGLRDERRLREKRLSGKMERLEQLYNMLATTVYLERPSHLALVISIWRRLEIVELHILEEDASRAEEAVGLKPSPSPVPKTTDKTEQQEELAEAPASSVAGSSRESRDEDADVRELENMLMGLEEATDSVGAPSVEASVEGSQEGLTEGSSARRGKTVVLDGKNARGEVGGLQVQELGGGVSPVLSPGLTFTIEEEFDSTTAKTATTVEPLRSPRACEDESTRELLGSIAATLTPLVTEGEEGDEEWYPLQQKERQRSPSRSRSPLLMTPSEMALVELMEEAGEESGELLGAGSRAPVPPPVDDKNHKAGSVRRVESRGAFDDALAEGSRAAGSRPSNDVVATPAVASASAAQEKHKKSPFSLGHERWITCGFVVDDFGLSSGDHEAQIGRALRGTSTVLSLDGINYFLARYPRSASRVITSSARRHSLAEASIGAVDGTGRDSEPFPVHAGDITRVIADLLSLKPPPSSGTMAAAQSGSSVGETRDGGCETESVESRALRLAGLPTWKLLDAPNAFQEMFACAALLLEAAQSRGSRGHQHLRYQECLLEARRVLHACLAHAPSSIDGFWAAAAVEGGVSPDAGDEPPGFPHPGAFENNIDGGGLVELPLGEDGGMEERGRRCALAKELERVLGMSDLELWEEDLPALGSKHGTEEKHPGSFRNGGLFSSNDDRVGFGGGDTSQNILMSSSSDWLLAGETARAGMIQSIAEENSGERSGPSVVKDGVFAARLLRPSKIISAEEAQALCHHLPITVASHDWVCLFSNIRHGSSLETLLARCADWEPTLVMVEVTWSPLPGNKNDESSPVGTPGVGSSEDHQKATTVAATAAATAGSEAIVFGGFASGSSWKKMGPSFAGDGRSFIFSFAGEGSRHDGRGLRVLEWAGSDRCFMTSDEGRGLGMGGGGRSGSFGFFLDADLRRASTGSCKTFGNNEEPLLIRPGDGRTAPVDGTAEVLEVLGVEVWGFRVGKAVSSKGLAPLSL